jgi:hypothetical protein
VFSDGDSPVQRTTVGEIDLDVTSLRHPGVTSVLHHGNLKTSFQMLNLTPPNTNNSSTRIILPINNEQIPSLSISNSPGSSLLQQTTIWISIKLGPLKVLTVEPKVNSRFIDVTLSNPQFTSIIFYNLN